MWVMELRVNWSDSISDTLLSNSTPSILAMRAVVRLRYKSDSRGVFKTSSPNHRRAPAWRIANQVATARAVMTVSRDHAFPRTNSLALIMTFVVGGSGVSSVSKSPEKRGSTNRSITHSTHAPITIRTDGYTSAAVSVLRN